MTTLRQAAQQALEALEELDGLDTETECVTIDVGEVITALRAALEQPEQEPVAIDWQQGSVPLGGNGCSIVSQKTILFEFRQPAAQPEQEPVAWVCYGTPGKRDIDFEEADINKLPIGSLLYAAPPAAQRPWVGLTDEEIESEISDGFARGLDDGNVSNRAVIRYVRVIEAALKERNT